MEKKSEAVINYDSLVRIVLKSLCKGSSAAALKKTLIKIGLDSEEAESVVRTAKEMIKARKTENIRD